MNPGYAGRSELPDNLKVEVIIISSTVSYGVSLFDLVFPSKCGVDCEQFCPEFFHLVKFLIFFRLCSVVLP